MGRIKLVVIRNFSVLSLLRALKPAKKYDAINNVLRGDFSVSALHSPIKIFNRFSCIFLNASSNRHLREL